MTSQREEKLQKELETETPKIDKINQLELRKDELSKYAKDTIKGIQEKSHT